MAVCKKFKGGSPKDLRDGDLEEIRVLTPLKTFQFSFFNINLLYASLQLQSIDIGL